MSERWILFDAVGTLIHPHPLALQVYADAARQTGLGVDEAELSVRFRQALQTHFGPDPHAVDPWWTNEAREHERWRAIVGETLFGVADFRDARQQTCFESLWNHFRQPIHWRLTPGIDSVWRKLRKQGFRIGIASNFDARLDSICQGLPPLSSADRIFHFAELGTRKPGLAFFRAIELSLGASPRSLTLVGDDLENDYRAARLAGWTSFWLRPTSTGSSDPFVLADLEQMPVRWQVLCGQQQ